MLESVHGLCVSEVGSKNKFTRVLSVTAMFDNNRRFKRNLG